MKWRVNRYLLVGVVFILAAGSATGASMSLLEAAWKGDTEKVQALLAKGADVNAKAVYGTTALMFAALEGHTDIVQALLEKDADVNAKAVYGTTALMTAEKKGHKEVVQLLKKAGAKE